MTWIIIRRYHDFVILYFPVITDFFFTENMHIYEPYYYIMYKEEMVLVENPFVYSGVQKRNPFNVG